MAKRLDVCLVEKGLAGGRDAAKRLIAEGKIYVDGRPALKAGQNAEGALVELRGEPLRYVSRGGLKLEKALKEFDIDLNGRIAADIGASAGGFTDCMLQNGAARVYAVDGRVINMEGTDARTVTLPEKADFASVDVAFISLRLVLPAVKGLLRDGGGLVALIKPQFEAGRSALNKKGVVRDPAVRRRVVEEIADFAAGIGFYVKGLAASPIPGPEGNVEFLMYAVNSETGGAAAGISERIRKITAQN